MGVGTAIGIGGIASAGIGAGGAAAASGTQANADQSAAGLQYSLGEQQLQQNQSQFNTQQQNIAPWLQQGTQGINTLGSLLSTPGQGLLTPWTQQFQAPSAADAAATPGYQFQLQQGEGAIQNSAAARGGLLSGNTLTAMDQYSQGLASTNYQQVYNNALTQYQQSYNIFQGNQSNEFNRLASLSGIGQQAATSLNQSSQAASNSAAGTSAATGSQVGNSLMALGGAQASGYAGISNALSGGASNISQYALLQNLLGGQGQPSGPTDPLFPTLP